MISCSCVLPYEGVGHRRVLGTAGATPPAPVTRQPVVDWIKRTSGVLEEGGRGRMNRGETLREPRPPNAAKKLPCKRFAIQSVRFSL